MDYIKSLNDYIASVSKFPFLNSNIDTNFSHAHQHLICDKLVANLLSMLVQCLQAKTILEVGTMIGYSAISLVQFLPPAGKIHTIEKRLDAYQKAIENFKKYNVADKIISHLGDANDIIPKLSYQWDMVFLDADKINYLNYYNALLPNLKKNGVMIVDNTLFHHKVLNHTDNDKNVIAIQKFNDFISKDQRVNNTLLNVRDGIQFITKL